MRDVSFKPTTLRTAVAEARLTVSPGTTERVRTGDLPKADPVAIARTAGVMAAKKTTEWIPYCHNIPIEHVRIDIDLNEQDILVKAKVASVARTGVEMEAMTAAAATAITLYDMLKIIDDDMEIVGVKLLEKRGGKSDRQFVGDWSAAVITVSDSASTGTREDVSGRILEHGLAGLGATSVHRVTVADEQAEIRAALQSVLAAGHTVVLLTGGTGVGPRDRTPEAVRPILETELPGVAQTFIQYSQARHPRAMLSRIVAGIAKGTVVVALPGSPGACQGALDCLFPALLHTRDMLAGAGHP